jgi:hypothetical protein
LQQCHDEFIPHNWRSIGVAAVARQCQHQHVEPARGKVLDQTCGGVLAQVQPKSRKVATQHRHQVWQQERPDRRDHAKAKRTAHRRPRGVGGFGHCLQRRQCGAGALHQFQPQRREHHVLAGAAVQDRGIELPLQRQDPG